MKKTVCDICGNYATDEEFIFPCYNQYYAMNRGIKIASFEKLETHKYNLCDKCKIMIANAILIMEKCE